MKAPVPGSKQDKVIQAQYEVHLLELKIDSHERAANDDGRWGFDDHVQREYAKRLPELKAKLEAARKRLAELKAL